MKEEEKKLNLKQRLALKGVKWAQKVTVKKASKGIQKLYEQQETRISQITDKISDLIDIVGQEKSHQIVCMICSQTISGFDNIKEQTMVLEMIKRTLEEYNKLEKTPQSEEHEKN